MIRAGAHRTVAWALLSAAAAVAGADTGDVIRCELAVIGGGSGGFGAALAAARMGVDVVLVERADRLGGTSVRGGVTCWEPGAGGTGIPFDLYRRLCAKPGAVGIYSQGRHMSTFDLQREAYPYPGGETLIDPSRRYAETLGRAGLSRLPTAEARAFRQGHWHGVVFEPDAMSGTMLDMLRETRRCRVMLNTVFESVQGDGERIHAAMLSGGKMLVADSYVDATGDAAVCVAAGCATMMGQEARSAFGEPSAPSNATACVNGVTLIYRVAKTSVPGIEPLPAGVSTGCWWSSRFPGAQINQYPNGDLNVNMLPTMDGAEFLKRGYGDAMAECRRRVAAHWHSVQTRCEEFRSFRVSSIAPAPGIRESRRVAGEYVLTQNDLLAGLAKQPHDDVICIADHAIDIHGKHAHGTGELAGPYGVPYRCLIPKGRRNLLVACRGASFSSLAASSCRLSRTMMQLGQAAGTAAALAKDLGADLPDVPAARLRAALRAQHVQLDHPMPADLAAHLAERD